MASPFIIDPVSMPPIGVVNPAFPPKLGHNFVADDGHLYLFAKATGAIANNAVCILTEPAMTMATGAGSWTNTNAAMVLNDTGWFKKTAI